MQARTLCIATALLLVQSSRAIVPVHVAFLTGCDWYSNWQAVGNAFSFKLSGQVGTATRVMCCSPQEKAKYDKSLLTYQDTWIAPSFVVHPRTGDNYAAYNKPEAVIHWLDNNVPQEEYVLVLDSDMIMRRAFLVEDMKPSPGWAIGARYTYMIGVANELADRHIPEVAKRNDSWAGPLGRRADQVGGFFFMHRDDLKRMSHDWLRYTEDVRNDTEAYRLSGDVYAIHPGDKPWISEMYGYAFGAAKANVWHKWDSVSMIYPEYEPRGVPKVMHYGLLFNVGDYKFDKHWHYGFDVTKCGPWDLSDPKRSVAGIFPNPPRPSALSSTLSQSERYRDLLSIETVITLNAAFCDYHLRHCPPSQQMLDVCVEVIDRYNEVQDAIVAIEGDFKCEDWHAKCPEWKAKGECVSNAEYMQENCRKSCGGCASVAENLTKPKPIETIDMLNKLRATLAGATTTSGTSTSSTGGAVADPDSKSSQITVVHNPDTLAQAVVLSPLLPPPTASPPPPSHPPPAMSPSPSPPAFPPPPPPPSPSPITQYKQSDKTRKDLLIRCYRMSLTIAEVKECVAAARRGQEFERSKTAGTASLDGELITEGAASGDKAVSRKLGSQSQQAVIGSQADDQIHGVQDTVNPPTVAASSGLLQLLAGLSTAQAVMLWAGVLLLALFGVPRLVRRRHRSGLRSE